MSTRRTPPQSKAAKSSGGAANQSPNVGGRSPAATAARCSPPAGKKGSPLATCSLDSVSAVEPTLVCVAAGHPSLSAGTPSTLLNKLTFGASTDPAVSASESVVGAKSAARGWSAADVASTPISDDEMLLESISKNRRRVDTPNSSVAIAPLFKTAASRVARGGKDGVGSETPTGRLRPKSLLLPPSLDVSDDNQTPFKRPRVVDDDAPQAVASEPTLSQIMAAITGYTKQQDIIKGEMLIAKSEATEALNAAATAQDGVNQNKYDIAGLHDKMDRSDRNSEVVFRGIPFYGKPTPSELIRLAIRISTVVGLKNMGEVELENAWVIPSNNMFVVKFATPAIKKAFFRRYLDLPEGLWTSMIGFGEEQEEDERVYAMDNLTIKNQIIRRKAVDMMKDGVFKKVKTRGGIVYVTMPNDPNFRPIMTEDELQKFVPAGNNATGANEQGLAQHADAVNQRGGPERGNGGGRGRGLGRGRGRGHSRGRGRGGANAGAAAHSERSGRGGTGRGTATR